MENIQSSKANLKAEVIDSLNSMDMKDIVEATVSAMSENEGFNIGNQTTGHDQSDKIIAYWEGVLLVPERKLIVGRLDGVIAGAAQLLLPSNSNNTSQFSCQIDNLFTATWARGYGLSNMMLELAENKAQALGKSLMKLSVRETRASAIALFEKRGYVMWGYLPKYELHHGEIVGGNFYYKEL